MAKQKESASDKAATPSTRRGKKMDHNLDDALDATFPASDPITVGDETGDEPATAPKDRRTPPIDKALVKKLAKEVKRTTKSD